MLLVCSFGRHQICSSVSSLRHNSIFGRYSLSKKFRARSTNVRATSIDKSIGLTGAGSESVTKPAKPRFNSQTSSPGMPGGLLCLALRPAGRATSSGFDLDSGCPGGAFGLRMLSNIGLPDFSLADFCADVFLAIFLFPAFRFESA